MFQKKAIQMSIVDKKNVEAAPGTVTVTIYTYH